MGSFGILRRASQSQRSSTKELPSLFFSLLFSRSISQLSSQSQWSFSQRSLFVCFIFSDIRVCLMFWFRRVFELQAFFWYRVRYRWRRSARRHADRRLLSGSEKVIWWLWYYALIYVFVFVGVRIYALHFVYLVLGTCLISHFDDWLLVCELVAFTFAFSYN